MSDVTPILERLEQGDGKAAEELLPVVYEELRNCGAQVGSGETRTHSASDGAGARGLAAPNWIGGATGLE